MVKILFIALILAVVIWVGVVGYSIYRMPNIDEASRETFAMINAERVASGIQPLRWDDTLAISSKDWSSDMSSNGYRHSSDAGIQYAENIFWCFGSSRELYWAWFDSAPHRAIYMNKYCTRGAVGIYRTEVKVLGIPIFASGTFGTLQVSP